MTRFVLLIGDIWRNFWTVLGNWYRAFSSKQIGYIHLEVFGGLPEYVPPEPWWRRFVPLPGGPADGLSLSAIRAGLDRIAADPRARGVVLRLDGLNIGWSKAQSLRMMIQRFRETGKRAVAYSDDYQTINYFVACACDEVLSPSVAGWNVIGLRIEALFLKDAMRFLDLDADVIAVSPYKTAGDVWRRSDISDEHRENLDAVLDGYFSEILQTIAEDRGLDREAVKELVDSAPLTAELAEDAGLIDGIMYLDQIDEHLYSKHKKEGKVRLYTWGQLGRKLRRPVRWRSGKAIGVVALEGRIVPGPSRRLPLPVTLPFVGNLQAGSDSIAKALRKAERAPHIAGVVLYIDSRGGSALASDLIWREVARLRRKKPVVAFLDSYAASGGYYVAVDADWIVAQPLTITGSIGVIWVKIVTAGLFKRLRVNRVQFKRGARADIFSDLGSLDENQQQVVEAHVDDLYRRFKQRVISGRKLEPEKVNDLGGGRVWTGRQALSKHLVDEMGDLVTAIDKVKTLAGLDARRWTPTVWIMPQGGLILPGRYPPQPFGLNDLVTDYLAGTYLAQSPFHLDIN